MKNVGWVCLAAAAFGFTQSAQAATCTTGPVSDYTASGFSCSVGQATFSDISITATSNVDLENFTPTAFTTTSGGNAAGLILDYTAQATPGFNADIDLTFDVSGATGSMLNSVFAALGGNVTGTGQAELSEELSNGTVLALNSPGATTLSFAPTPTLAVFKDQFDTTGTSGTSDTSDLVDAFTLTSGITPISATPLPGALPLFATGLVGLWGWTKRRKAKLLVA